MSRKLQSGCIQTLLSSGGKLLGYRCTLAIPKEVAQHLLTAECQCIKGRWFYVSEDIDFDRLWYRINLMQVTVNDWKVVMYETKKLIALERAVNYKLNQL